MRMIRRTKNWVIEQPLPPLTRYIVREFGTGATSPIFGKKTCHAIRYLNRSDFEKACELLKSYTSVMDEDVTEFYEIVGKMKKQYYRYDKGIGYRKSNKTYSPKNKNKTPPPNHMGVGGC